MDMTMLQGTRARLAGVSVFLPLPCAVFGKASTYAHTVTRTWRQAPANSQCPPVPPQLSATSATVGWPLGGKRLHYSALGETQLHTLRSWKGHHSVSSGLNPAIFQQKPLHSEACP